MSGRSLTVRTVHRLFIVAACVALTPLLAACGMAASTYPDKPIDLVVPYKPGGGFDRVARPLINAASSPLGQPLNIVNIDGAAGAVGSQHVAKARPDGYTLLIAGNTQLSISPFQEGVGYRTDDLVPVLQLTSYAGLMVAGPSSPVKTFEEMVSYARANPGKLRYATDGPGGSLHLESEALFKKLGIKLTMVPFSSGSEGLAAVLGGHVDLQRTAVATAKAQVDAGKVTGLYVTTTERNQALPNVPSMTDVGYPDVSFVGWRAVFAPKATPSGVIATLEKSLRKAAEDPEFVAAVQKSGEEVHVRNSAELKAYIQKESEVFGGLLRELGLAKS